METLILVRGVRRPALSCVFDLERIVAAASERCHTALFYTGPGESPLR